MNNVGVSTAESTKNALTLDEYAGRALWLAYFNKKALEEGLVTPEEYQRIQRRIAKIDVLKLS